MSSGVTVSSRTRRTTPRPEARKREERLQKILAAAGIASRRAAEALIREGRVRVNGRVVTELGTRAHPQRDRILVDGRRVAGKSRRQSYLVYKPRGVVSTTRDPHATKTVLDLVSSRERLFPVGRLDAPSEGLLLLTNDGELTQALLHPSFEVPRTYRVSVEGELSGAEAQQISAGIELDGRQTAPCDVRVLSAAPARRRGRDHADRRAPAPDPRDDASARSSGAALAADPLWPTSTRKPQAGRIASPATCRNAGSRAHGGASQREEASPLLNDGRGGKAGKRQWSERNSAAHKGKRPRSRILLNSDT